MNPPSHLGPWLAGVGVVSAAVTVTSGTTAAGSGYEITPVVS